jgi:hypothetical protein
VRDDAHAVDAEQQRATGVVGQQRCGGFEHAQLQRVGNGRELRLVEHAEHHRGEPGERALNGLERDVAGEAVGDDHVGRRADEVAAFDVAPALHLAEQRVRGLAQRVALAGLLAVGEQRDRGLLDAEADPCVLAPEHRPLDQPLGLRVDGGAAVDEQLRAVGAEQWERHRDRGAVDAPDAAEAEERGGHGGAGVARADERAGPALL